MKKNYKHNAASIITVGFPFVIYKVFIGLIIFRLSLPPFCYFAVLFWLLALVDFGFNFFNLISLSVRKQPFTDVCFLAFLFNFIKKNKNQAIEHWYQLGSSFDVFLSFFVVALFVGLNLFRFLIGIEIYFWNMATVLNVLWLILKIEIVILHNGIGF